MAPNYPQEYEMNPGSVPDRLKAGQTHAILMLIGEYLDACSKAKRKLTDGLKELLEDKKSRK